MRRATGRGWMACADALWQNAPETSNKIAEVNEYEAVLEVGVRRKFRFGKVMKGYIPLAVDAKRRAWRKAVKERNLAGAGRSGTPAPDYQSAKLRSTVFTDGQPEVVLGGISWG